MNVRAIARSLVVSLSVFSLVGCSAESGSEEDEILSAGELASQDEELSTYEVSQAGTKLSVTASALNMRSGGGTNYSVVEVLSRGTVVTVKATSGSSGWVNITAPSGKSGWVNNKYVAHATSSSSASSSSSAPSGGTCAPSRGAGVVDRYAKGLHDSIAFAEGTRNVSRDGYNVLFGFKTISSCASHPNVCTKYGRTCSTAAGRYQFLTGTWRAAVRARGLGSFEPENQERGAAYLISTVRKVKLPSGRAMTASEFSNAMSKLSWEWASLPPGRYGQPNKTMSAMRSNYCSNVGGC